MAERPLARKFLDTREVYDPQDLKDVKSLDGELREIDALIDRLVNAPGKLDASGLQVIKKSMDGFRQALADVAFKVRQMEYHQPSYGDSKFFRLSAPVTVKRYENWRRHAAVVITGYERA